MASSPRALSTPRITSQNSDNKTVVSFSEHRTEGQQGQRLLGNKAKRAEFFEEIKDQRSSIYSKSNRFGVRLVTMTWTIVPWQLATTPKINTARRASGLGRCWGLSHPCLLIEMPSLPLINSYSAYTGEELLSKAGSAKTAPVGSCRWSLVHFSFKNM